MGSNPTPHVTLLLGEINAKDVIVIKAISKKEMEYLMKKGFKFHEDIFKTYSGKNKYYHRECNAINKALDDYHNGLNVVEYVK